MFRLFPILILIIDVLAILDVFKTIHNTERRILWTIAIVFLPVLGPILYFVMVKR